MMDRKKLLLLYNPSAGRAQTSRNLDMLLQKFCTGGCETTVYPILDGLNAEDILAGAESAGYDIVVCCGGDGTLHHTVNGLLRLEQPPLLGYIPSGSTNDFAASLGLPKTPEDAADAVVNGRPHAIDAGDFGGELFCYVAAFGAFSAVSYETPQNMKNAMGHLAYIIEGVKRLRIGEKYPAHVEVGDQVFEKEFLFHFQHNVHRRLFAGQKRGSHTGRRRIRGAAHQSAHKRGGSEHHRLQAAGPGFQQRADPSAACGQRNGAFPHAHKVDAGRRVRR